MPIYEYKCDDCGSEFEATQGMDDPPLTECRQCSGGVHRLISFTSFTLKGRGWYSDGYAGASPVKNNGKKPKGNGDKPAKKDEKGEKATSTPTSTTTTLGKSD